MDEKEQAAHFDKIMKYLDDVTSRSPVHTKIDLYQNLILRLKLRIKEQIDFLNHLEFAIDSQFLAHQQGKDLV